MYVAMFVVSLLVLLKSSDFFVESAELIGLSFGISPFIIGVTIIAFGTSLPELATSIASTLSGNSEIVGGTVVGSNITNILLVLGITAVIGKNIFIERDIMHLDMPLLIISAIFFYFTLYDGFLLIEGFFFCIALVIFIVSTFEGDKDTEADRPKANWKAYLLLVLGGIGVSVGANYTVVAIEQLSAIGGVPKDIISLSAVAFGTSLPEVVVSIAAVRKGKQAIAVGNVLGSNLFNTYAVIGISRLFGPLEFSDQMMSYSIPFMLGVTFLFTLVCLSKRITRWEGAMLLLIYVYYISTLINKV